MKILRVTSLGYESGGAENGMVLLQPVLEKAGHTVKIFSSDAGENEKHFNDYSFKALSRQPFLLRLVYRIFYPNSFFALKKVLKEYNPDIVQVHTMYELSPSVLFLLKKYPTALTVHGAEDFLKSYLIWSFPTSYFKNGDVKYENLNLIGKLHYMYHVFLSIPVYRLAFKNVNRFIVFSKYMQNVLKKEGISATCVTNATKLFENKPVDVESNDILYVGRLEEIKGVQYLLRAFAVIKKKHKNLRLNIAGTGQYVNTLKKITTELKLTDSVKFYGHISRQELEKLYVKSLFVVIPSVWAEPFGKVGIEAMSVGRPVVASDVGGVSEWLDDGKTGFLVLPEDAEDLADKMLKLLDDKELLKKMSVNAVFHAKNFTIEKHAEKIVKIYRQMLHLV